VAVKAIEDKKAAADASFKGKLEEAKTAAGKHFSTLKDSVKGKMDQMKKTVEEKKAKIMEMASNGKGKDWTVFWIVLGVLGGCCVITGGICCGCKKTGGYNKATHKATLAPAED